jgi:1-deoxy-D-xylulose-5-phosphate reductoisomerase
MSTGVTILGSTGTIGVNTLDVVSRHPESFHVMALTANTQVDRLYEQCKEYRPKIVAMLDTASANQLRDRLNADRLSVDVLSGIEGLKAVASHDDTDIVMAAIVGAAGLLPTLSAVMGGKRVLIANKEPLVMSGHIFISEAKKSGAEILPIDSEHNAIFQCMPHGFRTGEKRTEVRRILLTCSGGPFREMSSADLATVTPEQAIAHPRWVMGRKISVDSATLMNKGLELIEACQLFSVTPDQVEIVIHPQSVIHSMVDYADGSVLAQLGNPDMRTPIANALAWPERIDSGVEPLNLYQMKTLSFEKPDQKRFPCLGFAEQAARDGGTAPTILNAANEIAVDAFLERRIRFTQIPEVIDHTLNTIANTDANMLEIILLQDTKAREIAESYIKDQVVGSGRKAL